MGVDGCFVSLYHGINEAARYTGLTRHNISYAINGRSKTAGGYTWRKATAEEIINHFKNQKS